MNRKKMLYALLKEIENGNTIQADDLDISKEQFGKIVELALSEELIKEALVIRSGIENKVNCTIIDDAKITMDGMDYLEENSTLAKTYKGLKELRDWIKL